MFYSAKYVCVRVLRKVALLWFKWSLVIVGAAAYCFGLGFGIICGCQLLLDGRIFRFLDMTVPHAIPDIIHIARQVLRSYPQIAYEDGPNYVCVRSAGESGFDVSIWWEDEEFVLCSPPWYVCIPEDKYYEALMTFLATLTPQARLAVSFRRDRPQHWALETRVNDTWQKFHSVGELPMKLLLQSSPVIYKQNSYAALEELRDNAVEHLARHEE